MPNDGERVAAKAALRSRKRQRLAELSSDERDSRSKQISERIVRSPEWQKAKRIALFVPLQSELDISGLNEKGGSAEKLITTIAYTIRVQTELQIGTYKIDLSLFRVWHFHAIGIVSAEAADYSIDSGQARPRGGVQARRLFRLSIAQGNSDRAA